ncbi:hypothetical protein CYY_010393, partial [Polysphondylium violaceum]
SRERDERLQREDEYKQKRELQRISDSNKRDRGGSNKTSTNYDQQYGKKNNNNNNEEEEEEEEDPEEKRKRKYLKEKRDFKPSGALAKEDPSSTADGKEKIIMKFHEPNESRLPTEKWVLYPFKEKESLEPYFLHRKKSFLFGRNREIVDIPTDHPSCSSQHAVIVYRQIKIEKDNGSIGKIVRPYLIDLESTNGTIHNGKKIDTAKFYELRSKDVIKFGQSTREFVLLREDSIESDDSDS